jgi:hypothetical protein
MSNVHTQIHASVSSTSTPDRFQPVTVSGPCLRKQKVESASSYLSTTDCPTYIEAMLIYETLPLDLRARVGNWSIKSDEIRFHNENVLEVSAGHKLCGPLKATYCWVEVVVNVYHLDLDGDTCCSRRLQNEL